APLAVAVAQAAAIVAFADGAGAVAAITLAAMAGLVAATAPGVVVPFPRVPRPRRTAPRAVLAALAAFTLVGLALRMFANRGIWLDEATSITQAQMPLGDLLESLRRFDVHPPLHHLVVWALAHVAGTGELVMRAPSYLAGAALIPVLHLTATELWDRRAGLVAAALGTVAPFLVWYAQEARMYSLFMLFATLALYAQLRTLRRGGAGDWALYALASAALVWTQYFGLLVVAVQQGAFLVAALRGRDRRFVAGWLAATLALAAAIAPLAPLAVDQFQANEAAGRGFDQPSQAGADVSSTRSQPGVYIALTNVVWALWGYHSDATMAAITSMWPLGLLVALALLGRGRSPRTLLVAACALLPAVALYLVGELKPFLFEIRYFAALAPLAVLLLARAATAWLRAGAAVAALSAALVATMGVAAADQLLNRGNPRVYDFEGALARLEREARPGDVVLYEPSYLRDVVEYYAPGLDARPLKGALDERALPARRVFVLASFQDQPPERRATLEGIERLRGSRTLRERFDRPQVRVWGFR
ncbi:MAG: glycosyltransferase family 39 protein, partial [Solirubrobacteraceae bacterium]|nr:glycosyltransferase family 39 protein [Solirubrobacteraceae bacterium]